MPPIPVEQCSPFGTVSHSAQDRGYQTDLILKPELRRLIPLSDTTIWRMERKGIFPRRILLSAKRVAWHRREVLAFVALRMAARQPHTGHDPQVAA